MLNLDALSQLKSLKQDIHSSIPRHEGKVRATGGRYGFVNTDDNQQFDIKFKRDDGINANSSVELPLNFIILTPSNNQNFGINSTLTVQLDGTYPNSTSQVELSSSCTNNNNEALLESTLFALNTSRLEIDLQSLDMFSSSQVDKSKTCDLTISVKRERFGSISGEYANQSYIKSQQSRAIKNMTLTF